MRISRGAGRRKRTTAARAAAACLALGAALGIACEDDSQPTMPRARFDTTLLDFGMVAAGSSAERTFTLTNTGGGVLEGSFAGTVCDPPTVPAGEACWTLVGQTTYHLLANESRPFTVRFAPYSQSVSGATCGLGNAHCQVESQHGILHCTAMGVTQ